MEKLSKTASTLYTFINIFFWCAVIMTAVIAVAMIVGVFLPSEMIGEFTYDLTLDNVILHLADDAVREASFKAMYFLTAALGITAGLFTAYSLHILRRILFPMIDGQPFADTVAHHLNRLSWVTLIGGGLFSVVTTVYEYVTLNMYDLDALFLSDAVIHYTVEYTADLSFIVVFLVLQLLAFVFRYGAALQTESDETL